MTNGFYAVRGYDGTWTIAERRDGWWLTFGEPHLLFDSHWWQIGRKIEIEEIPFGSGDQLPTRILQQTIGKAL